MTGQTESGLDDAVPGQRHPFRAHLKPFFGGGRSGSGSLRKGRTGVPNGNGEPRKQRYDNV